MKGRSERFLAGPALELIRKLAKRFDLLFLALVIVPTALAALHFLLLAADVYVSESRFVLRGATIRPAAEVATLPSRMGLDIGARHRDEVLVADYLRSREALKDLAALLSYQEILSRPQLDLLNRYPGLAGPGFDAMYARYGKLVTLEFEPTSGVNVLRTRGYTPADAKAVNEALLKLAESAAKQMAQRAQQEAARAAEAGVVNAQRRLAETRAAATRGREADDSALAARQLDAAQRVLEATYADATRGSVYVERIASANLPDQPEGPQRMRGLMTVLLFGLMLWGVVKLVVASVLEHLD
jgi:capsular polysaccharide transport system permease protein